MVKCSECGFLAARNTNTRGLDETEREFREKGIFPLVLDQLGRNQHAGWETIPVCFTRSCDIRGLVRKFGGKDSEKYIAVHFIINDDRKCKQFTEWTQGLTPREHQEMTIKDRERKWHIAELVLIIFGNLLAAGLATWLTVYLTTRAPTP